MRALAVLLLLATPVGISGLFVAGSAAAQSDREEQQAALTAARQRAADARRRAQILLDRATEARASVERTAAQRSALEMQVEEAQAELEAAEARLKLIDLRQRDRRRRLGEMQGPLIGLVAALQSFARRPTMLAIVQPRSVDDMVHLRAIMAAMRPVIDERTENIRGEIARARLYRDQEGLARRALSDSRDELSDRRQDLATLEAKKRRQVDLLDDEIEAERMRAYSLGERTRDIIEAIGRREADSDLVERLAALPPPKMRGGAGETSTGKGRPVYRLPVQGPLVTGLGEATDYGFRAKGITLQAPPDASVVAPAAGRIVFAGRYRSFGTIVIIDHGKGWTTLLTGLDKLSVTKGQRVTMGAPIGRPGDAYPGVTVELRRAGRPVDLIALLG